MHRAVFEDEDYNMTDFASSMASVSTNYWKANIDVNIYAAFTVTLSVEHHSSISSNVAFCNSINLSR